MNIGGMAIEVERKPIKHTHLSVFPPDARVHVSAPEDLTDNDVASFVISKMAWIRRQVAAVLAQPRQSRREYVSGEDIFLFGKRYRLKVETSDVDGGIQASGKDLHMKCRSLGTREDREKMVFDWYRMKLRKEIEKLLARQTKLAGGGAVSFGIRRMRKKWGTCNSAKRQLLFNLELARVPPKCIEYVVVHELTHLGIANHSKAFEKAMDAALPRWRETRKELNGFVALPIE